MEHEGRPYWVDQQLAPIRFQSGDRRSPGPLRARAPDEEQATKPQNDTRAHFHAINLKSVQASDF